MLEGYKPLDLSFLQNRPLDLSNLAGGSAGVPNLHNIAQAITAGSKWGSDNPSMPTGSPQKPTFWQGLMDLLSIGNYGVAGAAKGALEEHRKGGGILDDIGAGIKEGLLGVGNGAVSGTAAMLGYNDKLAMDNSHKTRFGDVLNELGVASKPQKDPNTGQLFIMKDGKRKDISEGEARNAELQNLVEGLGLDVVTDPLTWIGGGAPPKIAKGVQVASKAATALTDMKGFLKGIPEADATELNKGIPTRVPKVTDVNGQLALGGEVQALPDILQRAGKYKALPVPLNENATGIGHVPYFSKEAKDIPTESPVAHNEAPSFDDFLQQMKDEGELTSAMPKGRASLSASDAISKLEEARLANEQAKLDKQIGSIVKPHIQMGLASRIAGFIQQGPDIKSVLKNVFGWINSKHPGIDFTNVENYMENLRTHADDKFFQLMRYAEKEGSSGYHPKVAETAAQLRRRVVGGLMDAIKSDVENARISQAPKVRKAKDVVTDLATGTMGPAEKVTKALNSADASTLGEIIQKYGHDISTGLFGTAKDPEAVKAAVANGRIVKWSGPKQVNVWQTILHKLATGNSLKYATKSRYIKALQMLHQFEEHYMGLGHTPYSAVKTGESVPLRLSDVISHIGLENFVKHGDLITTILRSAFSGGELTKAARKLVEENPELSHQVEQAIENAKAQGAVAEAPAAEAGMQAGKTTAEELINENAMSASRLNEAVGTAQKVAKDVTNKFGGSPVASKTAAQWVKDAYEAKDPVGSAISSEKYNTLRLLSSGANRTEYPYRFSNAPKVTRAIEKQLGPIASVARKVGLLAKTQDWLGARFNAAYRNGDMRPEYLKAMSTAKATVALRARQVNQLVHEFGNDGELWNEAWDVARGAKTPASEEAAQLGGKIQQIMEDLFGGSGLRAGAELEDSVIGRIQYLRHDLNNTLSRYGITHRFTNEVFKDGRDFSKGTDWLKSWETWEAKNPLQLIYNIQNAVEHAVRTRNMFDEIISRFGTYRNLAGYTTPLSKSTLKQYPYFKGVTFAPEMAEQAEHFLKSFSEVNTRSGSKFLGHLDNVMSKWKAAVTVYRPSHYIRNLMGDINFNWLAGVNTTRPYSIAMKVMKSQKNKYQWDSLSELTSPVALKNAILKGATGPAGKNIAFTMKNGKAVTNDMVYIAAFQNGLLPSVKVLEDISEDVLPNMLDRIHLPGKLEGRAQEFVHNAHEQRDHFIRLAHFIDSLQKSGKSFEEAVKDASATVRKWHPDGMDMTKFERDVMRRAFPFYSWTRKAIPLAIESVYTNPQKVMLYPKLQYGVQQMIMPGSSQNWTDPFPEDQLWPDWMREKGIGPIMGGPGDYTFLNPSNPIQDLSAQFGNVPRMLGQGFSSQDIGGISSMLTPAIKLPAEISTGTNIQSQAPITDWTQYATGQIPGLSDLSRATNVDLGGSSPKFADQGFGNMQNIFNYLTAMGMTKTTPKTGVSGQFDLRAYLKRQHG